MHYNKIVINNQKIDKSLEKEIDFLKKCVDNPGINYQVINEKIKVFIEYNKEKEIFCLKVPNGKATRKIDFFKFKKQQTAQAEKALLKEILEEVKVCYPLKIKSEKSIFYLFLSTNNEIATIELEKLSFNKEKYLVRHKEKKYLIYCSNYENENYIDNEGFFRKSVIIKTNNFSIRTEIKKSIFEIENFSFKDAINAFYKNAKNT